MQADYYWLLPLIEFTVEERCQLSIKPDKLDSRLLRLTIYDAGNYIVVQESVGGFTPGSLEAMKQKVLESPTHRHAKARWAVQ